MREGVVLITSREELRDELCRNKFAAFAQRSFSIVEPCIPFEYNWHIDCLPYEAVLLTPDGEKSIGQIVDEEYTGCVLSLNHKTNKPEWKKVTAHMKRAGVPLYDVLYNTGEKLSLTGNHPIWANNGYKNCEDIRIGDACMRTLRGRLSLFSRVKNKVLQHALFWESKDNTKRHSMPNVWWTQNIFKKKLPPMLSEIQTEKNGSSLCLLSKTYLYNTIFLLLNAKKAREVLRQKMLLHVYEWGEQSRLYRWWKGRDLSSEWVQKHKKENNRKRWWAVFFMWGNTNKSFGCSPYRQGQNKQSALESCLSLQELPQSSKGDSFRNTEVGECNVVSITKSIRIPERVYNIEVEDNNNYFVNGILVHNCIGEHLEACRAGEIKRLIINLPPRSLKSYLVSSAFPAWCLGNEPHTKFINTSFGYEIAEANARKCKQIITSNWFGSVFPKFEMSNLLDRLTHFESTMGGQYYAATALSPITGIGCDFMICDDLLKPMEAVSETVRSSTNQNMRATLLNRFNDRRSGKFIMVMQRLHVDDPTGHLLKDGGYTLLKLPAETKQKIIIDLGARGKWEMPDGGLLFEDRLNRQELDQIRLDMSEYHYAGQFLQEPVPIGGGEFKHEWVQYYQQGGIKPKDMNVFILVDQAGGEELNKKKKKLSDWTVIAVIGLASDNNYYLFDMVRDRFNPTDRIETIFTVHKKWNDICGKPPRVGCEQIGLMTDVHYLKEKQKQETYNFPVTALGAGEKVSKEERIRRLIPIMQNGRFYVPSTLPYVDIEGRKWDLTRELIDSEMSTFPKSRYDDMIDCISRVLDGNMCATFPLPKLGSVAKARREASRRTESWEDY